MGSSLEIRPLAVEEAAGALDVWAETGMFQGRGSLHTWLAVDPGCIQAAFDADGEVVGICSCYNYRKDLAFMGFYAVRESWRGRGVGVRLWRAAQSHGGAKRSVGLNAVAAELKTYRDKAGFNTVCEDMRSIVCVADSLKDVDSLDEASSVIRELRTTDLSALIAYDSRVHGFRREATLKRVAVEPECRTLTARDPETTEMVGYGCIKADVQGRALIGPLYADTPAVARHLALRLASEDLGQTKGVVLMAASRKSGVREFIRDLGLEVLEEDTRCYSGPEPSDLDYTRVYGQHDLNFCPL